MRQIAFYGKGGIGKSTIACNLSLALREMGKKVFQIGCSPKVDSTSLLLEGEILDNDILSHLKGSQSGPSSLEDCIVQGYKGVYCAEAGGPEPATGCAGKGAAYALDIIKRTRILDKLDVDVIIYDVLGDVVCGGFAQPMRSGYAQEIYLVTSGELMSLYSANNICLAIKMLGEMKHSMARVGGIINNMRGVSKEEEVVEEFARRINVPIMAHIPRDRVVQEAEAEKGPVLEKRPNSPQAETYRVLARNILNNQQLVIPNPLALEDIISLVQEYQEFDREKFIAAVSTSPYQVIKESTGVPTTIEKDSGIRKIAMYGKGGIGKSTISANVSAALSHMGEKVMQVGCDPKRDSISTLCGKLMPTILDQLKDGPITEEKVLSVIHRGYNAIWGVESGGPKPGQGCAGGGVMEALRIMEQYKILERYDITFAIFDVLGDVVCGGFAQPMRAGYAREVYIVTCGEMLTLLQINNIARSIKTIHERGVECACAGLINNMRGVKNEEKIVEEVAELMGLPVIMHIPRSDTVQAAEFYAQTVIQAYPDSEQAMIYRELAKRILENDKTYIPRPISLKELKPIIKKYGAED